MKSCDIIGLPNYILYEDGRIYSKYSNKFRKVFTDDQGYIQISLYDNMQKSRKHFELHRLLAEHFIPNPNNYTHVHHKDENPLNNNLSNLEWKDSSKHNSEHHGKLTKTDAIQIRNYLSKGYTQKELAKKFKVSITTISKIKLNKIYKEI